MKTVKSMGASLMSLLFGLTVAVNSASADYVIKDGNGAAQTVKAFSCTAVGGGAAICPGYTPMDMTGAAFGVAANPFAISFGTGVQLPGFASPPAVNLQDGSGNAIGSTDGALNVNCPGCSGGGDVNINQINGAAPSATNPLWVAPETGATFPVTGTFWQTTQPISAAALPLPSGSATSANQSSQITQETASANAAGTTADTAYGGSGSSTIIAALKGLYAKLAGTLTVSWSGQSVGLSAGTNLVGKVGIDQTTPGTTNGVQPLISATGGWTPTLFASLSTTVETVKSSAGQIGKLFCDNPNSSAIYVETFDVSGSVTLGTTTPTQVYYVPATNASGFTLPVQGDQYSNAIKIAAVTTENGSTAPATPGNCNVSWK